MKITLFDFEVLLDALKGSLRFSGDGVPWIYTVEQRSGLINKLLTEMNKEEIDIKLLEGKTNEQI